MTDRALAAVLTLSVVAGCVSPGGRNRTVQCAVEEPERTTTLATVAAAGGPGSGTVAYLDRQKNEIEQVLAAQDRAEREGEALRVAFSTDVLFGPRSARLQPAARDKLDRVARVLNDYPRTRLDIIGHTDSRGRERSNERLSERRAAAVRDVLVADGVDAHRMTVRGAGAARPATSNDTESGRAMNRRVEIVSRPDDGLAAEARETARGAPTSPGNAPR